MKIELHNDNGDILQITPDQMTLVNIGNEGVAIVARGTIIVLTFPGYQLQKVTAGSQPGPTQVPDRKRKK